MRNPYGFHRSFVQQMGVDGHFHIHNPSSILQNSLFTINGSAHQVKTHTRNTKKDNTMCMCFNTMCAAIYRKYDHQYILCKTLLL